MSNALSIANIVIPAHLASRIGKVSPLSQAITGGLSSNASFPRISIKGSRFRIVEGDTETVLESTALDIVVVGANPRLSKTWYAKAWSADAEPQAPDCSSLNGISPSPESTLPQSDLCATCPHNAWGSKVTPNGQQVKACADFKRLAIVSADDPEGPVYLLSVTSSALKGLNQYNKELVVRGIPPEVVKTRLTFDTDASFPKLHFGLGGFLDDDEQASVNPWFGSDTVKEITGGSTPDKIEVPKIAHVAPVAPKPAPVVEAPVPAPVQAEPAAPKRGFGATKPVAPVQSAPEPKAAPKAAKVAVAKEDNAASSLADEIAALVGEVADDE